MPFDPELEAKITEVDNMAESDIDDKLQAMLVSLGGRRVSTGEVRTVYDAITELKCLVSPSCCHW